ncbi:MAG: hypothetical protein U5L76_01275 [Patescibacteria group bacterium]|nr:hypothetical protein [Patescibacteria group bacterium]
MKVYFFSPKTSQNKLSKNQDIIIKTLRRAGVDLYTNLKERSLPSDLAAVQKLGGMVLDEMQALIIGGSQKSPDIGYLLAMSISQKKPALYLYEKGSGSQDVLKYLSKKNIPKTLQIKNYQKKNLEKIIVDFLNSLKGKKVKEMPRIKFTLRITPSIEKYLHYKTHNTKKSKADFLREYVEKMMEIDDDFQDFLRKGE